MYSANLWADLVFHDPCLSSLSREKSSGLLRKSKSQIAAVILTFFLSLESSKNQKGRTIANICKERNDGQANKKQS